MSSAGINSFGPWSREVLFITATVDDCCFVTLLGVASRGKCIFLPAY